jgi:hypothetical protein
MVPARCSVRAFIFLSILGTALFVDCEKERPPLPKKPMADDVEATLSQDGGKLSLVLQNRSIKDLVVCQRNFYLSRECLDIRKYPDTSALPPEKVFAPQGGRVVRKEITLSDFQTLGPGRTLSIPVDLSCIRNGRALGDSVFLSVFFKNVDPFSCSNLNIDKCDKATQDYCRSLHCIPNASLPYWAGEIRTPYVVVSLKGCVAAASGSAGAPHRDPHVTVLRRSRSHPLKHRVF